MRKKIDWQEKLRQFQARWPRKLGCQSKGIPPPTFHRDTGRTNDKTKACAAI